MLRIGWFATGRGEGSRGLLQFVQDRIVQGKLDARIEFVFSNREPGEAEGSDRFFQLTRSYDLPLVTHSSARFRQERGGRWAALREAYDAEVMDLLQDRKPDICVLAGYMLILGGPMCRRYDMLNLHPALPDGPIGIWQDVVWSLIEHRAERTGAMVHLVTQEVDRGPVVSYCTAPIVGEEFDPHWQALEQQDLAQVRATQGEEFPLFELIHEAASRRERPLLLETLRAVADGKVVVRGGRALDADGVPLTDSMPLGLCLDERIDLAIAEDGME
jgi:folate-dependent phosphoribosylglycinamide formyltransferase PurN